MQPANPSWCFGRKNVEAWIDESIVADNAQILGVPKLLEDSQNQQILQGTEDSQGERDSVAAWMSKNPSLVEGESRADSNTLSDIASSSSPYDSHYRQRLIPYRLSIDRHRPNEAKVRAAMELIERPRPDLLISENELEKLCQLSIDLSDAGETEVVETLFSRLVPQLSMPPRELPSTLSRTKGQPWTKAVPVPPAMKERLIQPRPLALPKPDALFSYNVEQLLGFEHEDIAALFERGVYSLVKEDDESFCSFLGLDFKSLAKKNTRWIAENQQVNAGAIRCRNVAKLLHYARRENLINHTRPVYLSVAADNEIATFHVHVMEEDEKDGRTRYISYRLKTCVLREPDGAKAFFLGVLNILLYGEGELAKWYRELFKDCREQYEKTGIDPLDDFALPHPKLKRQRSLKLLSLQASSPQSILSQTSNDELEASRVSQRSKGDSQPRDMEFLDYESALPPSAPPRPSKQLRKDSA